MTSLREGAICAATLFLVFTALMLIGFPMRFDGAMPWELVQ